MASFPSSLTDSRMLHPSGCQAFVPHKNALRSGKWTRKEEQYARSVIQAYGLGLLDLPICEQSLRSYLAKKLFCSPSRITKKFKGQTPMNILDAQRLCRSRVREGRPRSNQDRAQTMKALAILEREFLTEVYECSTVKQEHQDAARSLLPANGVFPPQVASPLKSPIRQGWYPQDASGHLVLSPCHQGPTGTTTASFPAAPTIPSPLYTPPSPHHAQNSDGLLQMSLKLNAVLTSLLQSTCGQQPQHHSNFSSLPMMQQKLPSMQNNLVLPPRRTTFHPKQIDTATSNLPTTSCTNDSHTTRSTTSSTKPTQATHTTTQATTSPKLSGMDLLCKVADGAVPLDDSPQNR